MAALDRFGGPESWDLYCLRKEEGYEALIEGAYCLDCGHCTRCTVEDHENIGYCRTWDIWVTDEDTPRTIECEVFEE